ncbi:MAG: T9SS type A sorting domain-containing protein [Candidatus Marinimicrobia bacterium]|nr:T9SS type A sorting domain-containing protein [Candidatus Neomarinimicrobiota bacterium]
MTIRNNKANGSGGGIFHWGSGVTLENVTISNNVAREGGGTFSQVSSANWNNVIVKDNSATYGDGGIHISAGGTPTLRNVTVQNNSAKHSGGVRIHGSDTAPKFINVKIIGNKATGDVSNNLGNAAGVNLYQSSPIFENVLIADNVANNTGAAIGGDGGTPVFKNVTIAGNISANHAAFDYNNADPIFINCIIWNNSPQSFSDAQANFSARIVHSNIEGGWDGEGNIDRNPAFVNVDTTGGKKVDYHLLDWSPAIGAGVETISIAGATYTIPVTDIEDNPRPNPAGSNPDMGAFENQYGSPQNAPPVIATQSDLTIAEDGTSTATLTATDANDDAITYSAVSDTNAVTVSVSSATLTLTPNANWHGVATIKAYASDGSYKDSTTFKLTVTPVQDAPTAFEWVSSALETINITKTNLTDTYELKWSESEDVDGDTIDYLVYAKIGVYPAEEVEEITDTTFQLIYEEILEHVFEGSPVNGATVSLNVKATDGIDTVDVTGDNRVIYVNRYEYLSTEGEGVPVEFALHENYPNPFNPTTTLRFDLPEVSDITLTIYNMLGQRVKTFNMNDTPAGFHSIKWNATNDYGDPVGAGVYLYQLRANQYVKTRKMVLLK